MTAPAPTTRRRVVPRWVDIAGDLIANAMQFITGALLSALILRGFIPAVHEAFGTPDLHPSYWVCLAVTSSFMALRSITDISDLTIGNKR